MTPEQASALPDLIASIAETKATAVLHAMVIVHVRLVEQLIIKGVITRQEFTASMSKLQKQGAAARQNAPELFEALSRATMMLEQAFAEMPAGKPS